MGKPIGNSHLEASASEASIPGLDPGTSRHKLMVFSLPSMRRALSRMDMEDESNQAD